MPDLHIFKAAIGMCDPVALQDQLVAIHYVESIYYKRVTFLEGIPDFQCLNIGAVLATNQSGRTNVANLEMADNEFGLFRWYPIDDFQCQLFHPAGIAKGQLRNVQAPYDMNILANDPNLVSTEIAVWENNRPAMIAVNANAVPLAMARIRAIGYRFHTKEPVPLTRSEKALVDSLKVEITNAKWTDTDYLKHAMSERRIPVTDIWASGRGIGD
ncbi:MAG: hypothetical protein PHI12_07765 [Dehalococcoidales bacterium]|nr:hypothetical protein [Dehalococcoidales bacterium]